jgi:hypothetical protein
VKCPGQQLLAGAGLTTDQHRQVAVRRHPGGLLQGSPERLAATEDRLKPARLPLPLGEPARLDPTLDPVRLPLQPPAQEIEVARQGEEIGGAVLDRGGRDPMVGRPAHQEAGARRPAVDQEIDAGALLAAGQDQGDIGRRPRFPRPRPALHGDSAQLGDQLADRRLKAVGEHHESHSPLRLCHGLPGSGRWRARAAGPPPAACVTGGGRPRPGAQSPP